MSDCVCGAPDTPGITHRQDQPCYGDETHIMSDDELAYRAQIRDQEKIWVVGNHGRRLSLLTSLLDIAIANARRGEQVIFWDLSTTYADSAFIRAYDLLIEDEKTLIDNAKLRISWPDVNERACVQFGCPQMRSQLRGFRATVVVNAHRGAPMPYPEPAFANIVING